MVAKGSKRSPSVIAIGVTLALLLTALVVIFGDLSFIRQTPLRGLDKVAEATEAKLQTALGEVNACNKRLTDARTQLYTAQAGSQENGQGLAKQLSAAQEQIDSITFELKQLRLENEKLKAAHDQASQMVEQLRSNNARESDPAPLPEPPSPASQGGHCGRNGFFQNDRGIFGEIQLASWPFQKNWDHLPKNKPGNPPTKFMIEIGANARDVVQVEKSKELDAGAFLLTFEPLLDKYAKLMSRFGGVADSRRKLGLQHKHGIVFPFAVGCQGTAKFHVSNDDGCSSILPMRGNDFIKDRLAHNWKPRHVDKADWLFKNCVSEKEERRVPCISLEHVIGNWLGGQEVDWLKVDGQGFDLAIVMSAGKHMDKIRKVIMEVQADNVAMLYAGQPNCSSVLHKMLLAGFKTKWVPSKCHDGKTIEDNIEFWRD